jgi:hypothetical protein
MAAQDDILASINAGFLGASPDSFAIVPDDNNDLPAPGFVRSIRANGAGDVVCVTPASRKANTTRTMKFLAGERRDVIVLRVLATGTTATGLEGMP